MGGASLLASCHSMFVTFGFGFVFSQQISDPVYRRIFVYTFCLINIRLSLSDDANKIKTLNIERA